MEDRRARIGEEFGMGVQKRERGVAGNGKSRVESKVSESKRM